jgi:hypothetical protein
MSEENAIRVIEGQPEVAAIEIPHEAGRDLARVSTAVAASATRRPTIFLFIPIRISPVVDPGTIQHRTRRADIGSTQ